MKLLALFLLLYVVIVAFTGCGPSARAAAFEREILRCPVEADSLEASRACRHRVRCTYRAEEFPAECSDGGTL